MEEGVFIKSKAVTNGKLLGMVFLILVIFMADLLGLLVPNIVLQNFLVVTIWGIGLWFIYNWTKEKDLLKNLFIARINKGTILLVIAIIVIHFLDNYVLFQNLSPQILGEYSWFISVHGNIEGNIAFILQLVYYVFESLLVLLMLSFFQLAGERKTSRAYIPWGGLGIAFTWGIVHAFHSFEAGVYGLVMSMIIGTVYILGKKAFIPAFLMTFLIFMI